jgi:AcrR family transcriptional regulator
MGKGELTRQSILERATALASQVGLEGLTIGRLAKELDLSKSGLFAHFRSKELLQVQLLQFVAEQFVSAVVRPALKVERGEPRLRALFEGWLEWENSDPLPGGCLFVAASTELDDKPGPAREQLVRSQKDWLDVIATCFRSGIREGHFRSGADPDQFAHDLQGVILAYHHASRLLSDPKAEERARAAFESLLGLAREPGRPKH